MVNKILNAITKQLGTTFGNSYRYYMENVEQNLTKPCFTTDVLIPLQRSRGLNSYDRTMPIVVHYFSDSKTDIKKDCYAMAEQIIECLEYLPFENTLIRGEDISWEIVDDVLQVFITYKFMTKKVVVNEDTMDELQEVVGHSKLIMNGMIIC